MAKGGPGKGQKTVPNKHLHSRISYLYQAATYLATQATPPAEARKCISQEQGPNSNDNGIHAFPPGLPYHLLSQMQLVSFKAQVRLSQDIKHSICKRCNSLLIPGSTSSTKIENLSRGGKKPWADILVTECNVCGAQKRFPVGAKRQPKKKDRTKVEQLGNENIVQDTAKDTTETGITPLVEDISIQAAT